MLRLARELTAALKEIAQGRLYDLFLFFIIAFQDPFVPKELWVPLFRRNLPEGSFPNSALKTELATQTGEFRKHGVALIGVACPARESPRTGR